jgi:uncharacterized protein with von Willebrand factor type A (vWA) domain
LTATALTTGDAAFVELLVAFGNELRSAGLAVGSGDVLTYSQAMASLDPTDLVDLYWAGRSTLVNRRDQIAVYDEVFRRFFLDEADARPEPWRSAAAVAVEPQSVLQVPATDPPSDDGDDRRNDDARLGLMASAVDVWRSKSFAACTAEELAALRRIMAQIRLTPPERCTRRTVRADDGRKPDLRRTVRETMRMHGELAPLSWRRRRRRVRPLVLILDVSGSMADYSRALLQFAYSTRRATARTEVFCFGTRLTRITRALERRRPDDALDLAAKAVFDWEGGTRIGDALDTFVRRYARRGASRGAIVVICSDGLDRGDPAVLARAMERLARLSHRVVWMNPHKGAVGDFRPTTTAMMVAAPYVDVVWSGHDLRSLEAFAALLPSLG